MALLSFAIVAMQAHEANADDEPPWRLAFDAGTMFPLSMGGRTEVISPGGIRLVGGVGAMPISYANLIHEILAAAGAYPSKFKPVFTSTLAGTLVVHAQVGWRPWSDLGWYFDAGYAAVTLGSSFGDEPIIGALAEIPPELQKYTEARRYEVSANLHMVVVEAGHRWVLDHGLSLRWSIGFAGTVAAQASIDPPGRAFANQDLVTRFANTAGDELQNLLASYVFLPTIGFGVGYTLNGSSD